MVGSRRLRRKGSEIIALAGPAAAIWGRALQFCGHSGTPTGALDASEMTVSDRPSGGAEHRRRARVAGRILAAALGLALAGCGDTFTQVYQRGYIAPQMAHLPRIGYGVDRHDGGMG